MTTKAELLASSLRASISSGAIGPGERLSSIRRLAAVHSISPPTVLSALRRLEHEGVVEARSRSGFYVRSANRTQIKLVRPHEAPRDVGVTSAVRKLFDGLSEGVTPLGAALPDPEWLPIDELRSVVASVQKRLGPGGQGYSMPPGRFDARRQVALLSAERGTSFGPDDVIITHGATEALFLALQATCRPGDTVLVEAPTYFGHLCLLERLGMKALEAPTDPRTGLDPDAVERLLETQRVAAILCTPTVQNPLGATMTPEAKRKLIRIATHADVPVIEDDVYGLLHDDMGQPPLKAYDANGLVLYCGSVSKCLAPGWRIGWVAPGRYRSNVMDQRFGAQLSGAPVIEAALATFLADPAFSRHLKRFRRRAITARSEFTAAIERSFPAGTEISRPTGGFLLWLRLPVGSSAMEIARSANSLGATISPGPLFSASGRLKRYMRLNAGHDFTERYRKALEAIGSVATSAIA